MARQARTRQPKSKFYKIYTCHKCGRKTNTYHLELRDGQWITTCKPTCPPPVPAPPST